MTKEVTDATFQELVLDVTDRPVLVDFWATWCGPCRMMAPVIEEIDNENPGLDVYKLDTDTNPATAARYSIMAIPTMVLFKNGQAVASSTGAVSKAELMQRFAQFL